MSTRQFPNLCHKSTRAVAHRPKDLGFALLAGGSFCYFPTSSGSDDITVKVKHDLKIDFYYMVISFLFGKTFPSAKSTYLLMFYEYFQFFSIRKLDTNTILTHSGSKNVIYVLVRSFLFGNFFSSAKFQTLNILPHFLIKKNPKYSQDIGI